MSLNEPRGFSNSTLWTWDGGTTTAGPAAYSYRTDRSMELQFENSALRQEVAKTRRALQKETERHANHVEQSRAVNNALLDEVEALHFELETLRQALTEALK